MTAARQQVLDLGLLRRAALRQLGSRLRLRPQILFCAQAPGRVRYFGGLWAFVALLRRCFE